MARIDNLIFRSKIWIIVVAAVMLIGGGVLITLGSTQPYALAADGGKVIQPYSKACKGNTTGVKNKYSLAQCNV